MTIGHSYDVKRPVLEHSGEAALAITDHELFVFVVPVHLNRRMGTVFIVVAVAFIFIQAELAVCSGVDSQLNWIGLG